MECVLQWLDTLDDYVCALAHLGERLRSFAIALLVFAASLAVLASAVFAALSAPALAPAIGMLAGASLAWRQAGTRLNTESNR